MGFVQGTKNDDLSGTGHTTFTCAYGSNVVKGNLLVACVRYWETNAEPTTVSDTVGSTWTKATPADTYDSNIGGLLMYYAIAAADGANTVTFDWGSNTEAFIGVTVAEYSGYYTFDNATFNDQATPGTGTDAVTSTSITPSRNNALLLGWATVFGAVALTSGTGWTDRVNAGTNAYDFQELTQGIAGSQAATWTEGSAAATKAMIAVFLGGIGCEDEGVIQGVQWIY